MIDGRLRQLQSQALAFGRSGGCEAGCLYCRYLAVCYEGRYEGQRKRDDRTDRKFNERIRQHVRKCNR